MKPEEYIKIDDQPTFSKNIIILLLSIALLGTIGYIFYEKVQHSKEIIIGESTIDELERSRELLKQELRLTRSDYDISKTLVKIKDTKLEEKDRIIFEKQKKIQNLLNQDKISRNDINTAKRLITSLRTDLGEYKREIEILQVQNSRLRKHNTALAKENTSINNDKTLALNSLQNEKNERANERVEVNSTLSISNYNLVGINVKNSGKEVESGKAKRIDKLQISFDVDPNSNSVSETKELFIAIHLPDGSLGKFDNANSGIIALRSGQEVEYSDRISFSYDSVKSNPIIFDWKGYSFTKGIYKIDIYNNGFKIGQQTLVLK